uniref:rRNA methyltransferase 2, mitochondrial n=1 Tax=Oncorhynchus kisutch TaxID=8019 RepID=A0A8C7FNW1_ONCKI
MWYSVLQKSYIHTSVYLLKKAAHNLKGKSTADQRWIVRQFNDPFVKAAHVHNYRCRNCGAAPGAWNGEFPRCTVVGIDLLRIAPLDGAHFLSNHDITDPVTHAKLLQLLPGALAHVIMSDMAPNKVLQTGGSLICKYWDGALAHQLQQKLSAVFRDVRTVKPKASRKESSELFFLARSYRENKIV